MRKYYYHLTSTKNLQSILKDGLRANEDGDIFIFINGTIYNQYGCIIDKDKKEAKIGLTKQTVADHICINQIFKFNEFVMLKIDSRGISGELVEDVVGEIPSYLHKQWIAKQSVIKPEWLSFKYYKPRPEEMLIVNQVCEIKSR